MKYRMVKIEEFDTWKVNINDIKNKTYPDYIANAVQKGIIEFHKSLSKKKPDSVIGVLNEGLFGTAFSEDYHITYHGNNKYGLIFSKTLYENYEPVHTQSDASIWLGVNKSKED